MALPDRVVGACHLLALAVCVCTWFVALRAPLWLDETVSMYLIHDGPAGMSSREAWPDAPAYSYLLWLWTKVFGTSEITLRVSSILPMAVAAYLLYCAARRLFDWDLAFIATIIFCLHPIIVFASIDVRPYAIAALAINSSILALILLRRNDSNWMAALFGLASACIVEFQLLFAVLLPALLLCFLALKPLKGRSFWRQLGVASLSFSLAFLPAVHRLVVMYHARSAHVFATAPRLTELGSTLTARGVAAFLIAGLLIAVLTRRIHLQKLWDRWAILVCLSLALVPALSLYCLSKASSIHVFIPRYELVAVPGIALSWALFASFIGSRSLRLFSCSGMVVVMALVSFTSVSARSHGESWKASLAFVEKNASPDHAPVLICSGISESDFHVIPAGPATEDNGLLVQLSYYKLTVPVTALPYSLNEQAVVAGSRFVQQQAYRHQRFLAMAFVPSYKTLDWLARNASEVDDVHVLGIFDGVKVLEFVPRAGPDQTTRSQS